MLPVSANIDPGSWRFNPTLLVDKEFLALLNATVSFFSDTATSGFKSMKTSLCGSVDP